MRDENRIESSSFDDIRLPGRLLRLFTLSSILSMFLILSLVGFSTYAIFTHIVLGEAEDEAIRYGHALLVQELEPLIRPDLESGIALDNTEFFSLDQRIKKSLEFFQIAKVKIYTKDKRIIYSTDHSIIGELDKDNKYLEDALNGKIVSELQSASEVWDLTREQRFAADMVETYIPIKIVNDAVLGAFEIYMKVTSYQENIKKVLTASLGSFFVILSCVFGTLLYIMRRATKTIYVKTRELRILSGLLPICSFCKKIRNKAGEWEQVEKYITKRSESKFSHGVCPECKEKNYPYLKT